MTDTPESRDHKLANLFAQFASLVMQRGLDHAYRDDPHLLGRVTGWRQAAGARFELRVTETAGSFITRGMLTDDSGEPLAELFTIVAGGAAPH